MSDSHNRSRASGFRQFRAGIVFLEFLAPENLKNTIPAPSAVACRRKTTSNSIVTVMVTVIVTVIVIIVLVIVIEIVLV